MNPTLFLPVVLSAILLLFVLGGRTNERLRGLTEPIVSAFLVFCAAEAAARYVWHSRFALTWQALLPFVLFAVILLLAAKQSQAVRRPPPEARMRVRLLLMFVALFLITGQLATHHVWHNALAFVPLALLFAVVAAVAYVKPRS